MDKELSSYGHEYQTRTAVAEEDRCTEEEDEEDEGTVGPEEDGDGTTATSAPPSCADPVWRAGAESALVFWGGGVVRARVYVRGKPQRMHT